jgi:hypothetical protein
LRSIVRRSRSGCSLATVHTTCGYDCRCGEEIKDQRCFVRQAPATAIDLFLFTSFFIFLREFAIINDFSRYTSIKINKARHISINRYALYDYEDSAVREILNAPCCQRGIIMLPISNVIGEFLLDIVCNATAFDRFEAIRGANIAGDIDVIRSFDWLELIALAGVLALVLWAVVAGRRLR